MEPTNRQQRRHPEKLGKVEKPGHADPKTVPEDELRGTHRTQDDLSVRAKSSGHGKKTADKWNQ